MKQNAEKIKKFISGNKRIVYLAVLIAVLSGIWTARSGQNYSVSVSFLVSRVASAQPIDYNYDSYYALRATDEFGSSIAGWFKMPETVGAIYKRAEVDFSPSRLSEFSGRFKPIKVSPSSVELRFGCSSLEEAEKISKAAEETISEKAGQLADSSKQGINFVVSAGDPVVIKNSVDVWQKTLAGFLIGLVFGVFLKKGKEVLEEA